MRFQLPPALSMALDRVMQKPTARFHRSLYLRSGGRLGAKYGDADVILLVTKGRASGRAHTVPLLTLRDRGTYVVVASNAGRPNHPGWYLNVRAHPVAWVNDRGRRVAVDVHEATDDEWRRLWPRLNAMYPGFAHYMSKTDRELPVLILRPREAPGSGGKV